MPEQPNHRIKQLEKVFESNSDVSLNFLLGQVDTIQVLECARADMEARLVPEEGRGQSFPLRLVEGEHIRFRLGNYRLIIPEYTNILMDWTLRLRYGVGFLSQLQPHPTHHGYIPIAREMEITSGSTMNIYFYAWATGYLETVFEWSSVAAGATLALQAVDYAGGKIWELYSGADIRSGDRIVKTWPNDGGQRMHVVKGGYYRLDIDQATGSPLDFTLDIGIQSVQRGD